MYAAHVLSRGSALWFVSALCGSMYLLLCSSFSTTALLHLTPCQRTEIMPAILAIAKDKSWRVRWSLAHKTHEAMCALKGNEEMRSALSAVFNSLLGDSEAEVRKRRATEQDRSVMQKVASPPN